jgi:macrolide-specific efflux system membrane fusion protein
MNPSSTQLNRPLAWARRRWRLLATAALMLAAGFGAWCVFGSDSRPAVQTATVELGSLEKTVTAVGALKAKDYVDVGTQVSGRVLRIHVEIGDRVKKGDLIAEIDPTVYESTVRKDQANLDNLKAQLGQRQAELALAQQQLVRNRNMAVEDAVSRDTVEQAEAAAKVAEAALVSIKAQIKAAEATLQGDVANLGYTKIYAPIAGTVVSQTTLEGQTVNSSQSVAVIVQIANLDVMTVWAQVAEADVNKLKPGMSAYFTTLGDPERRWQGTVRQIQPTPTTTNDVVLYNALIDVDNPEGLLLPSMTVQSFFMLAQARDVPIVPMSALTASKRDAGTYRAMVVTNDGSEPRTVKIGVSNRNSAEVVSGLEVGEKVVVRQTLMAGAARSTGQQQRQRGMPAGPRL